MVELEGKSPLDRTHNESQEGIMVDPRNIAHDKKVQEEKQHKGEDAAAGLAETPQPGKKQPAAKDENEAAGATEEQ